ncbi:hypothetical protein B0H16DRAFT_1732523 [Mycena metata]|uniref:Uncharacterized protein n=1 Tax=Mycena metata TaxID=1033252 RepID=A0AAD7MUD1_9AGAR|nr:hypothetical protein B0H16DRAFT_1732523 [Mycena metata]
MNDHLNHTEERQCTVQEKSFLRALLHRDYLSLRAQIYTQQITIWAQTPDQVCYTVFDYTHGPVTVTVYPWGEGILDHPPSWMARCYNHILRVFKEPGLLEIHCMAIPNGLKTYRRLFSMRHADSQIFNALQEVSERMQEIPRTDPGFNSIIADGLKRLLEVEPRVTFE